MGLQRLHWRPKVGLTLSMHARQEGGSESKVKNRTPETERKSEDEGNPNASFARLASYDDDDDDDGTRISLSPPSTVSLLSRSLTRCRPSSVDARTWKRTFFTFFREKRITIGSGIIEPKRHRIA
ncbi:hypothetical protein V9T40_009848 [Parthenolecanium corni]|uniref:Uncharacterized protein n=1 Tax=Parthenolecanium corni TaxID=536013 RepID=A0AAN9Y7T3_9HEMI